MFVHHIVCNVDDALFDGALLILCCFIEKKPGPVKPDRPKTFSSKVRVCC